MVWEVKTLGDILSLEYGKPLDKSKRKSDGLYPAYGANGVKTRTDEFYYDKPTIIVGRKGSAGELTLSENKFWPLDVTYFVKFDEDKYDLNFLYYLLDMQNLPSLATGVKPGINRNNVYALRTKTPDIEEQKRIVAILDEAFEQIDQAKANAEQNLKNPREVFESAMDQMFTKNKSWVSRSIADCFKLRSGDGLTKKQMDQNGIYPVFGGNGIAGKHNAFNLTGSNIIIGRVGALCGNVRFLKEDIWLTDNAFKVIDLNYDFDLEFLTYLLNHKKLLKYARQAAQPVISNSSLKDVVIAFPKSLQEQKNIVENLDNLQKNTEKLQKIYQQKIQALDELKQSLLQKAFSGELTKSADGDAA